MSVQRRKFTDEEKLEILRQAETVGITAVLRTYSLSYSVFARWKQKFMKPNPSETSNFINKAKSELKILTDENVRLKRIIAQQALDLERKDEELRKTTDLLKKR